MQDATENAAVETDTVGADNASTVDVVQPPVVDGDQGDDTPEITSDQDSADETPAKPKRNSHNLQVLLIDRYIRGSGDSEEVLHKGALFTPTEAERDHLGAGLRNPTKAELAVHRRSGRRHNA